MSIVTGKKVGTVDITALYSENQDVKVVNVTPVDLYEIGDIPSCAYDGEAKTPSPNVYVKFGTEMSQPLIQGEDYTVSYANNVNAGTATLTVTGIGNYQGTLAKEWTIENADMVVDTDELGVITAYDGENHANPLSSSNIEVKGNQQYVVKYGLSNGSYTLDECPEVINVNDSKTIYFQITADNHNTMIGSYYVGINPIVATLSWGETSWIYDGNEHSTTCEVSNLIGSDTCDVVLMYNSITNIGQVDVLAKSLSNSNYILASSEGVWQTIKVLPSLFIRKSGVWTPVKSVYKRIGGAWVAHDMTTAFAVGEKYVNKN